MTERDVGVRALARRARRAAAVTAALLVTVVPAGPAVAVPMAAGQGLSYHGGPVLTHPSTTYLIYWKGPSGTLPAGYASAVAQFIGDWSGSVAHGVLTQYYQDVNGIEHVSNLVRAGGTTVDSTAFPHTTLSDGELAHEVRAVVVAHSLPEGYAANYAVLLPVQERTDTTCAWHDWVPDTASGGKIFYSVIPYYDPNSSYTHSTGCRISSGPYPHGEATDNAIDMLSHELSEIATNPWHTHGATPETPRSWYVSANQAEIGDLCRFVYGPRDPSTGADLYLHDRPYLIQEEWSNSAGNCSLGPPTDPSIHVGPASLGTITDGRATTKHVTATGGPAPYRYYVWDSPSNMANVPSWANLSPNGTLTINPPAGDQGTYSFYVYAYDGNDQHSPFARDKISFATTPAGGGGPPSVKEVQANGGDACALISDGTVYCWGANFHGQLGDGTTTSRSTPVEVSGISDAVSIAAAPEHTCVLLKDETIDCWGWNNWGQLGNGTTNDSLTPVQASGITNAVAIAAADYNTCALLATGAVDCWGSNHDGQLGDASTVGPDTCADGSCSTAPEPVSGISSATGITVAETTTTGDACALLDGGTVDCWGSNDYGELGNGSSASLSSTPVAVSGITSAVQVAGSFETICARLAGGGIDCWGYGGAGVIGNGMTSNSSTPVAVTGITNAIDVSAADHGCAVLSDGSAECWGANENGQLGDGTNTGPEQCGGSFPCSTSPTAVSNLTGAVTVSAGDADTCAVLTSGGVDCWGWNPYGQLGDGTTTNSSSPVQVTGLPPVS